MKGVDSRYFVDALKRFDKLLADFEMELTDGPWLAGKDFSLADVAYAPYMIRLEHLQLQMLWDRRPRVAAWYAQLRERSGFKAAINEWLSQSYLTLMEDKGKEAQPKIRAILQA